MNELKAMWLGTVIAKFTLPMELIDDINNAYDEKLKELKAHNESLAGKIKEEKLVNELMTDHMKGTFLKCFKKYIQYVQKPSWKCFLNNAWINEMRADEYNPLHFHASDLTAVGLSSVLVLKRPKTYGVEYSNEDDLTNGHLEFTGGQQDPLSISSKRVNAQVGEFFVFPYTMLHGVYPFNGTDEVRRTLSYNCDLIKPALGLAAGLYNLKSKNEQ